MKRIIKIALTSCCAMFFSCCECNPFTTCITYEVDGTASYVSVLYNNDSGDNEYHSSIALPWVKKFSVKYGNDETYGGLSCGDGYPAYISATAYRTFGKVTVRIYVDGKLVREKSNTTTDMTATAFYSVR
jgi:hypothetical protein